MPPRRYPFCQLFRVLAATLAIAVVAGCSSDPITDPAPPTIEPARPADSPPQPDQLAGSVRPLDAAGQAALFDSQTGSLAVLGASPSTGSVLTVLERTGEHRTVQLPATTTAMAGDDQGRAYLSTRGGYFRVDLETATVAGLDVEGQQDTDFTAVTRRADGKLVLGSSAGSVYTLDSETTVGAELKLFARVDALAAEGDTTIVLDRGQTSVTTLNSDGTRARHALRAGEGATTMAVDPDGRLLVADTRGDSLLVFGTDPLMLRQRFPVRDAPYGLAGSSELAWVSQTETNTVIGYDLSTGIPVEKVRYRTVRQPNSLAFDDSTGTLYVVSGSGAGVQVIPDAGPQK